MKNNKTIILFTLILSALILGACGGSSNRFVANSWPGITVLDDTVYIANNNHIYAIDPSNGQEITRYPKEVGQDRATFFASPVFVDGQQILGSGYNNVLYSFDVSSGSENWKYENSNRFVAPPLVTDDVIYAPNADHHLHALDHSGNLLWGFETAEPLWASPVTDGEYIYQVSMDGILYALNPRNGEEVWKIDLGSASVSAPVLENGILYIGTFNSEVLAIDTNSRNILWHSSTNGWAWASPVLVNDTLYATDLEGWIYAIDSSNGTKLWQYQSEGDDKGKDTIAGSALVNEESVYFTTGAGWLYALDLEGNLRWSRSAGEDIIFYGTPVLVDDRILVGVVESEFIMIAYDTNGTVQWQFEPTN